MKTPLTYYGGKQRLANIIIKNIPDHNLYCEPFAGGAAVFFAKEPSPVEVLNDTNGELVNFYATVKNDFDGLAKMISASLHSRSMHRDASVIYNNPHLFTERQRAWALWVTAAQSFSKILDNSFGFDINKNITTKNISNKRELFSDELAIRLQNVCLESADANYVVKSRDSDGSFFYCDPPYFNSHCHHYRGYTEYDFENLLRLLSNIKGKFLLSSYPSHLLQRYTRSHGWHMWSVEQNVSVNAKGGSIKRKQEVLTANYPISL